MVADKWKFHRCDVLTIAKSKFVNSVVDVFHQRSIECVEKIEQAIVGQITKPDEQQLPKEVDVVPIISHVIYNISLGIRAFQIITVFSSLFITDNLIREM